ncbi:MAG: esterase [Bacteroidales bacterium]|nr:esterase [Bacteroidales bacterium]
MKKIYTAILVAVFCATSSVSLHAQFRLTGETLAAMFPAGVVSPQYNPDGSVTFRCEAPDASEVKLSCQMLSQDTPMVKDERGVWTLTVTPEYPDIYPYCFVIDGTQVADPNNVTMFPNEGFKNSLVDVRGAAPSMQDLQDVPHGKVSYRYYHSGNVGFDRPMCVFTPAGYDPDGDKLYPVLYLIHGMTDTYETWFKVGRMNNILDNLIAQGLCREMIVVMPYANPYPEMMLRGLADRYDAMGTDIVVKEIVDAVMPYIEKNYKVRKDADGRAVAGFSLGGRQALAAGLGRPDVFHYVCAFAPAIFQNEWNANFENGTYSDPEAISANLRFLWVSCGIEDRLWNASSQLDKALTERSIKHYTYFCGGGHTWMNCRDWLEMVSRQLFR